MRAVVYHGPVRKAWEEVPTPVIIDDTDAIVRVDAVTICGTDLHILKGDVPAVTDGRILGHEAVGHRCIELARPFSGSSSVALNALRVPSGSTERHRPKSILDGTFCPGCRRSHIVYWVARLGRPAGHRTKEHP